METLPTAEELLYSKWDKINIDLYQNQIDLIISFAIEHTKLHCKRQAEVIAEKAEEIIMNLIGKHKEANIAKQSIIKASKDYMEGIK